MKLNNTYLIFDSGNIVNDAGWEHAHKVISDSINAMRWPDKRNIKSFRIPRIISIQVGGTYTDEQGKINTVRDKKKTLRNGVRPLRDQFRSWMAKRNFNAEEPLSLMPFFKNLRERNSVVFPKYPQTGEKENIAPNESVGNIDFWFKTDDGFRAIVEWETGNISSSHRSLNKMCLALMGGLAEAAVLIVPSVKLYPHLTDRIGNIRELQPYFYFWNQFGRLVDKGLLAVIEVEQNELFKSRDLRKFVPTGTDGNSKKVLTEQGQIADDVVS
jgi:hypothetical protein